MNDRHRAIVAVAALLFIAGLTAAPASGSSSTPAPASSAATVPVPAPSGSPQSAASLLAQAQLDAASGRNQQARDEAARSLALDPTNLAAEKLLGDVEYRLEHYAAAETAYKAVLAKTPGDRDVHNRLGGVYSAQGRIDDAITQFKLSLPSQEGMINLVEVYKEEGRLKELEAQDELDMDRSPSDDPISRFELATVLDAEKRYSEAISLYDQAIDIRPGFWEAHNGLGIVYGEVGRYDDAITQYKMAISAQPNCFQCFMNWGVELINSGNPKTAIDKIQKSLTINSQFGMAYMNLGVAYDAIGDSQKAIELYEQAISFDPHVPQVYYNLGSDYFEHGFMNLAYAAYIKGIAISPRDAILHLALGYYYQNRHEYDQAIEQYKLAMTYDPTDPRAKEYLTQAESLAGH